MRKLILYAAAIISPVFGFSQQNELQQQGYVYGNFVMGKVVMKNGSVVEAGLNYNTNNQNIAFMKDKDIMLLSNLDEIDTVYLDDKKFFPINGKFYYLADNGKFSLLVSYGNRTLSLTTTTDHNGSGTQSTNQVSNTISNQYTNRRYDGKHNLEVTKMFWIQRSKDLYKVTSVKQYAKAFPEKEDEIKTYASTNNIDFSKEEDLVKLTDFVQGIVKK